MLGLRPLGTAPLATLPAADAYTGTVDWRFANAGYLSRPDDAVPNAAFDPRLLGTVRLRQEATPGRGGLSLSVGEAELWDGDRRLLTLTRDYAVDGQDVALDVLELPRGSGAPCRRGLSLDAAAPVLRGSAAAWRRQGDRVLLPLRLKDHRLTGYFQENVYTGLGGDEGGFDLAGRPKPVGYGHVPAAPAVLVDAAARRWQVHDGPVRAVLVVWHRGVRLVRVSGAPGAGQYAADEATGFLTLGFDASGPVLVRFEGDARGGYVSTAAEILARILARGGLDTADLDPDAFAHFAFAVTAEVGLWVGPEVATVAEVAGRLLAGVGAEGGMSRLGLFRPFLLGAPDPVPAFVLTRADILALEEVPPPEGLAPPWTGCEVEWGPNFAGAQSDLDAATTAEDRAFLLQAARIAPAASVSAQQSYRQGLRPRLQGLYRSEAAARAEAERRRDLWTVPRRYWRIVTDAYFGQVEPGMTGSLEHPADPDFAAPRHVTAYVVDTDLAAGRTELLVYY